jgi:hypothetical protein
VSDSGQSQESKAVRISLRVCLEEVEIEEENLERSGG